MPNVRQIAADSALRASALRPPAGYILLIQDVAYGSRYKLASHKHLDEELLRRGGAFAFETRVLRVWQADDLAAGERELQAQLAPNEAYGDWFDLARVPPATGAPRRRRAAASLHRLARNDAGAESLLKDARIVNSRAQPQAQRSGRRPARLAFMLALLVLVAGLVARRGDIQRVFDSIQPEPTRYVRSSAASSRAATPAGKGVVFYTKISGSARVCASLSCDIAQTFSPGMRIVTSRYVNGQRINGNNRWIRFGLAGRERYVHSSFLSRVKPAATPTNPPPTATYTATNPPPTATFTATVPPPTATYTATNPPPTAHLHRDESAADRDLHRDESAADRYLHRDESAADRDLHRDESAADRHFHRDSSAADSTTFTATVPPPTATYTATVASTTKYVVETVGNQNANIRACPQTSCDIVGKLAPGAAIDVLGPVSGETVFGADTWLEIRFENGSAFIHGALAAAVP